MDLGTDFELFGAVAARKVELQPHSNFHFDEALLEADDIETTQENILYWGEAQRDHVSANTRRDPFALLNVNAEDLASPADAWEGVQYGEDSERDDMDSDSGSGDDGSLSQDDDDGPESEEGHEEELITDWAAWLEDQQPTVEEEVDEVESSPKNPGVKSSKPDSSGKSDKAKGPKK